MLSELIVKCVLKFDAYIVYFIAMDMTEFYQ